MPYLSPGAEASSGILDVLSEHLKQRQTDIRNQLEMQRLQQQAAHDQIEGQFRMQQLQMQNELRKQQLDEKNKADASKALEKRGFQVGDYVDPTDPDVLKAKQLGILPEYAAADNPQPVTSTAPLNPTVPNVNTTQTLPAKPPALRWTGTQAQKQEAQTQQEEQALLDTVQDPNQKQALRIFLEGRRLFKGNVPAGFVDAVAGINQKPTEQPLVYVNARTKQAWDSAGNPINGPIPAGSKVIEQQFPPTVNVNAANTRADRSWQVANTDLNNIRKPINDQADRVSRVKAALTEGSPVALAAAAPDVLLMMAGGTNFRMNEAEIKNITGARSVWEDLRAAMQRIQTDPNQAAKITPNQVMQMRRLADRMGERVKAKFDLFDNAQNALANTDDVHQHRTIMQDLRKRLDEEVTSSSGTAAPATGGTVDWRAIADEVRTGKKGGQ